MTAKVNDLEAILSDLRPLHQDATDSFDLFHIISNFQLSQQERYTYHNNIDRCDPSQFSFEALLEMKMYDEAFLKVLKLIKSDSSANGTLSQS